MNQAKRRGEEYILDEKRRELSVKREEAVKNMLDRVPRCRESVVQIAY